MYPSSTTSSSSLTSLGPSGAPTNTGLTRYSSAPSSLLTTAVDSVINPGRDFSALGSSTHQSHFRFFHSEASSSLTTSESNGKIASPPQLKGINVNTSIGLQRSFGSTHEANINGMASASLIRHSSSPAGFLNQLAHASAASNEDKGFSMSRGHNISRLNSQLSFTRPQSTLSQISEETEHIVHDLNREREGKKSSQSYVNSSYGIGSWEDPDALMFSMGPSKRSSSGLDAVESQFLFSMQPTVLEMGSMDKLLNIPPDSVPCKIRAKRGFATHPRSIAERERRTRISGKLKKLQELVPNMDKQTSYADMLDLAVQHIRVLQNQVQKLNKELEGCTCGCRKPRNACGEGNR